VRNRRFAIPAGLHRAQMTDERLPTRIRQQSLMRPCSTRNSDENTMVLYLPIPGFSDSRRTITGTARTTIDPRRGRRPRGDE
jgi:hypothetical protein